MSLATELTTLNSTKLAIKQALLDKDVDLTGVNFAGYADKIANLSAGGAEWSQAYYDSVLANVPQWVRNPDWLPMPTLTTRGFVGLLSIFDTTNEVCAFTPSGGAYTVDWGDGNVENFASGVKAEHVYTYANISSSTTQVDGSRQVIVKAYPQSGQVFTGINLSVRHNRYAAAYESHWLDIWLGTDAENTRPYISNTGENTIVLMYHSSLERFVWDNPSYTGTDLSYMFTNLRNLANVAISRTDEVTTMSNMFSNCYSLQTIPLLNTAAVTNMSSMFYNCYSLQTIPLLNTAAVTNMSSMFNACYSLQTIPLLNTAAVTNMSSMFYNCYSLQTIPLLNTAAVTNMSNMFYACYSLSRIQASGFKYTFSVANCGLTAEALNEIYTNLSTVTGQTITVTGNVGTATDDPSIATAKGWTVTG